MLSITSNVNHNVIVCKADFSLRVLHEIGEALTTSPALEDDVTPFAMAIRNAFGQATQLFRWYCIDASDTVNILTFSHASNPKLLQYRGRPVQIASADADPLLIRVAPTDIIKPSWRKDRTPAAFIGEA